MANQFPLAWPHTKYGENERVKNIYFACSCEKYIRYSNGVTNPCRGEVEQHLGPERRSGSRTVSGMNSHKAERNGCHAENWLVWTETAMLSTEAWIMTIEVYTVYLCASKWRRGCIKVGLVQSQCRSVVEVRICLVTRKSLSRHRHNVANYVVSNPVKVYYLCYRLVSDVASFPAFPRLRFL